VHDPDATKTQAGFRDVPLTVGQSILPRWIRAYLTEPERPIGASRLFLSLRNDHYGRSQPLTLEGLKSMLATLGETTGIKCNAYRFRHTFCTWCADAGMHMLHLQQLLGHASSDMVAYYYRGKTSEAVLQAAARVRF
jgi:integrase